MTCPAVPVTSPNACANNGFWQCNDPADHNACCEWLAQPCKAIVNIVIARKASFLLAYLLHQHRTFIEPTLATYQSFARLMRQPARDVKLQGAPGNSEIPLYGMRMLGGEALFDPHLTQRAQGEFYASFEEIGRRGPAESVAPHYAGVTISLLSLFRDVLNPEVSADVDKLLALHFLVPAHAYLPGGGLGAAQDRDKSGGGITDPDPTAGSHLIPAINMFVNDPDLPSSTGYQPFALMSDYQVPEVIRSIYLDKGSEPSRFWHRSATAFLSTNGSYPGKRDYQSSGWQGFHGKYPWDIRTNPWHAVVLPGGEAEMGLRYGEGGGHTNSAGLYLRRPGAGDPSFSVLYHRLPRPNASAPTVAPDPDDGLWDRERSQFFRRMLWGKTAVTLWDTNNQTIPPGSLGDPNELLLDYTEVHLPDFCDPTVADECRVFDAAPGNTWYLGRSGSAYVAFLPLGDLAALGGEIDKGDWIYLKLDSPISGNITVLATTDEFRSIAAFKKHIEKRFVAFTPGPPAEVEVDVEDAGGTTRMRLAHTPEERAITINPKHPSAQEQILSDADYFPAELVDSPWALWDESGGRFELTIDRAEYNSVYNGGAPLVYDFGSATRPTTPANANLIERTPDGTVKLRWNHSWDDDAVESYSIYYHDYTGTPLGGSLIGTMTEIDDTNGWGSQPNATTSFEVSGPADDPAMLCQRNVRFSIEANDGSQTSAHRAFVTDVPVWGDGGLPPHAPTNLKIHEANARIVLSWSEAFDECGIHGYLIWRNGDFLAFTQDNFYNDLAVNGSDTYSYEVQAWDTTFAASAKTAPLTASLCAPPGSGPTEPVGLSGTEDVYGRSLTLSWQSDDDCGVFSYNVVRLDTGLLASVSTPEFTDSDIEPGASYDYEVTAFDFDGQTSTTASVHVAVSPDTEDPDAPATVTAQAAPGPQTDLSWEAGWDYWGGVQYEVWRSGSLLAPVDLALPYTDTTVSVDSTYYYQIRAIDPSGNSAISLPTANVSF